VLCRVSPKIREALHITGLEKQFTIEESETAVVGKRKAKEKPQGPSDLGWLD
jgi:anti-anti-sigma regulatory factor